jgi:hypothetical protein
MVCPIFNEFLLQVVFSFSSSLGDSALMPQLRCHDGRVRCYLGEDQLW